MSEEVADRPSDNYVVSYYISVATRENIVPLVMGRAQLIEQGVDDVSRTQAQALRGPACEPRLISTIHAFAL